MPCFGTTARTRSNAEILAERLGATLKVVDISNAVKQHFKDIGQSMTDRFAEMGRVRVVVAHSREKSLVQIGPLCPRVGKVFIRRRS